MKTLKANQLFIIKSFFYGIKGMIHESAYPELVSLQYDFKKNRYHLNAEVLMTLTSKNVFDLENPHKLIGTYLIDSIASYGDNLIQVSCRPTKFVWYSSPNEVVTDRSIIDNVVSPFKIQKGGVQKCVDGLDEEVAVVGVGEADDFMSGCQEVESECK